MKICNRCKEEKPLTDFYKHPKMFDGYLNQCKTCKREQAIQIRNANLEYYQEYDRNRPNKEERNRKQSEYNKTLKGKEVHDKAIKNIEKQIQLFMVLIL